MEITTLEDLVNKINSDLGPFCDKFLRMRETLSGKQPTKLGILFAYNEKYPNWAKNKGGGTEIQYQIDFHNETIRFGLGFNAIYVRYNNDCSPVDYIKPFVNAYFELKNTALVSSLKSKGYEFIIGSEEELRNIQVGQYYLFGKKIQITNKEISDKDYDEMIKDLQGDLFALYCNIFEKRNEILEKGNQMQEQSKKLEECIALLKNSHNIILHGAPGTGKTYLAKQIAYAMGAETEFVQFHPSYDYTDFVEGLRPIKTEDSKEIGFERMDGVFKKFCKKALNSDNFESVFTNYVEQIKDGEEAKISENAKDGIEVVQQQGEGSNQSILIKKESLAKYLRTCVIDNPEQEQYIKVLAEKLKEKGYKKKNCVFIIDEINRGEMSKIFGELFFSIDPGYRGEKGAVKTQYSNMQENANEFDSALGITTPDDYGHFFVPENVYIIGTMNDIDRNVECMDFAFRRRFAFKEITAAETRSMLDNHKGLNGTKPEETVIKITQGNTEIKTTVIDRMKNRMNNLNNAISGTEGLSSAYHIGASYFLKFNLPSDYKDENDTDEKKKKAEETEKKAFDNLWDYHLKPLLQEYLRGMEGAEQKLKDLEDAYNLKKLYDENGKEK